MTSTLQKPIRNYHPWMTKYVQNKCNKNSSRLVSWHQQICLSFSSWFAQICRSPAEKIWQSVPKAEKVRENAWKCTKMHESVPKALTQNHLIPTHNPSTYSKLAAKWLFLNVLKFNKNKFEILNFICVIVWIGFKKRYLFTFIVNIFFNYNFETLWSPSSLLQK